MPQAGFQIGSYSVVSRLGHGGMGEVWLATRAGKQCVVKTLLPHLAEDERVREMFLKEGRVASMISHPQVVQIYELGSSGGQFFMVLEYVDGTSLDRLLLSGRALPAAVAAYVAVQACAGLSAIHEQRHPDDGEPLKIVHRDISPSNLLLSVSGDVKVADFGIAKTFTTDPGGTTTVGTAKGKIVYMAPEQARGHTVDHRADVFALGVVLHEMLAGDIPYARSKNDYEMLSQVVYGRSKPLGQVAPTVPSRLAEIVSRAMAVPPESRWPSARAMRAALEAWLLESGGAAAARAQLAMLVRAQRKDLVPLGRETAEVRVDEVSPSMIVAAVMHPQVTPKPDRETQPVAHPEPDLLTPLGNPFPADDRPTPINDEPPTPISDPSLASVAALPAPLGWDSAPETTVQGRVPRVEPRRGRLALIVGLIALGLVALAWGALGTRASEQALAPPPDEAQPRPDVVVHLDRHATVPATEPEAATERSPRSPKPVAARRAGAAKDAKADERTVRFETVPVVDVWAGGKLLGRTPLTVSAPVQLRLVSETEGIDYAYRLDGEDDAAHLEVPRASLHVRVDPWAEVTLDGRALGMSPVPPLDVYAGKHVIDLVNDDLKTRRRLEVELAPREARVVREKL